ncbi:hypothetical protein [Aureimonas pseudogalii]|uniref:Uncharacterized protein n=1 Tax=Aureimonas pseudogalii TaxID=1744844 RepID=A0A7W6MLC9_9HYPH|nr:hypothetical protein [Aureimonas pseudogalii]MBB3999640.1 hypothetical protein [Aureimonas pseudogalii]
MSDDALPATTPGQLLERISAELARQADAVRSLHALTDGAETPEAVRLAQTIDTASQVLDEIAGLLGALAPPPGAAPDAPMRDPAPLAENVRLSELRRTLFDPGAEAAPDTDGDLDLF